MNGTGTLIEDWHDDTYNNSTFPLIENDTSSFTTISTADDDDIVTALSSSSSSADTIINATATTDIIITDPVFYGYMTIPSALLSALCSIFVIYHSSAVTQRRKKTTFHRLLLMLCACDLLSSTTLTLEPFVTKTDFTEEDEIFGGHWSCEASGFVKLLGVTCGSGYNAFLSTYFYLVVCRGWRDDYTLCNFEPYAHCVVIIWAIYLLIGIFLEVYNPGGTGGCWSTPYPPGCQGEECIRGEPWGWIYDLSTSVGFLMSLTTLIVTNTAIYCKVRKREQSTRRFHFSGTTEDQIEVSTSPAAATAAATTSPSRPWRDFNLGSSSNRSFTTAGGGGSSRDFRPLAAVGNKTRQVASQSFYYCGGYLSVYLITFLHGICTGGKQNYDAWWYPIVRTAQEITFPLQGFLNFIVYLRPRYIQWRELFPDRRRLYCIRATLSTKKVPTLTRSQRRLRRQRSGRSRISRRGQSAMDDGEGSESAYGEDSTSSSYCDMHEPTRGSAFLQLALDGPASAANNNRSEIIKRLSKLNANIEDLEGIDYDSNPPILSSSYNDDSEKTSVANEENTNGFDSSEKPRRSSVRFQLSDSDIESDNHGCRDEVNGNEVNGDKASGDEVNGVEVNYNEDAIEP